MAGSINRYPIWKYLLIIFVMVAAFFYAAPNLYPEYPAVQVRGLNNTVVDQTTFTTAKNALKQAQLPYLNAEMVQETLLFRFANTDIQLRAKEVIQQAVGENYVAALNLANSTPPFLASIGAVPMKWGLDLRGGVHFLLQVDVDSVLQQRVEGDLRGIGQALREERIRYASIKREGNNQIELQFRTQEANDQALNYVNRRYPEFSWESMKENDQYRLIGKLSPQFY